MLKCFPCFFLLGLVLFSVPIYSQNDNGNKWKYYICPSLEKKTSRMDVKQAYLVKYGQESNRKSVLQGVKFLRILDKEYAIIETSVKRANELRHENVYIKEANDLWKLTDNLLKSSDNEMCTVIIKAHDKHSVICAIKNSNELELTRIYNNLLVVTSAMSSIKNELLPLAGITYIGLESMVPKLESNIADYDISVNRINKIHHSMPAIDGHGSTVSIKDNLLDTNDLDLLRKYIHSDLASDSIDGHATDMATIIAGLGNSSDKGRGVAHQSRITSSNYTKITPDANEVFVNLDVKVQNHSYGTENEQFYGALAEAYDKLVYSYPTLIHVFSSGNMGEHIPQVGSYAGLGAVANLTGNFKLAKNILTVGAVDYNEEVLSISSRGPAYDGRIKPELVAYSTIGTSNAAALVSGISLLLQQQFKDIYDSVPPTSLLKASLINSARDVASPGPDFKTGYGNVNGFASLEIIRDGKFFIDHVNNGDTKFFSVNVPDNAKDFKVTLVWIDKPAQTNSNIALVNDLDLLVKDTTGKTWHPWVLDHSASLNSLTAPASIGADHLNNIEQITISDVEPGNYKIEVKGFDVSVPGQVFAIAYQWTRHDQFEWDYPTGSDRIAFDTGIPVFLRWENTHTVKSGVLQISYDHGTSWQTIDDQVDLADGVYSWKPDSGTNSVGILKMKIADLEYYSDEFAVSSTTNIKVSLNCEETIELKWNEHPNAQIYSVYNLQGDSMRLIKNTTDETYVFDKKDFKTPFFSVQPVFNKNILGQRSQSINLNNYDTSCYINSFYAIDSEREEALEIILELSSLYLVESVELYKIVDQKLVLIKTFLQPEKLNHVFYDHNPNEYLNNYQVKVILSNGQQYLSEIVDVFFLSEVPYFVFPNPATNEGINIYTKDFGEEKVLFKLFSLQGMLILEAELTSDRNYIELNNVNEGVYLYHLESTDGVIESSLLLIL